MKRCTAAGFSLAFLLVVFLEAPLLAQGAAQTIRVALSFSGRGTDTTLDTRYFLLSPEVVQDKDGTLRLTRSVLVTDEMGATDFHQAEVLNEAVQARKVFVLESGEVTSAELLFFGGAKEVQVNGKVLASPERLASTGWSRVQMLPGLLKAGENEVVFKGPGQLLLEPGPRPGRSFKSSDGGRTWVNKDLGAKNNHLGEYLVRLRLGRHAPHGTATSQVLDLWASRSGQVPAPGKIGAVSPPTALLQGQPAGTRVAAWLRTGPTPAPDGAGWTPWFPLDKEYRPVAPSDRHRWAQLKLELSTNRPQATPRVPPDFQLSLDFLPDKLQDKSRLTVLARQPDPAAAPVRSSTAFVYQEPSPRLKLLRERYKLDEVIAPGKTEMEQLMLLRYWVRNQWHTAWGSHPANWMPPWDALIILESKDQPDCLTMCTHYAAVFTQCCVALGWNARHCILDHHCTAEVYVNQYDRWVMMDAGNSPQRADVGLHFERNGLPLSARELQLAQRSGATAAIQVHFTPAALAAKIAPLCRPAPPTKDKVIPRPDVIPLAELQRFPVCQLDNYRRYAFPARNNYLSSLVPGELYQGWSEYFYDGYCWVGDSSDAPRTAPEYSRHLDPTRPQDVDWQLNWTRIHLSRTGKPGELRVDLETHTPNLARFERLTDSKAAAVEAGFTWTLRPGRNELALRSVNHWNKTGSMARMVVSWEP